MTGFASIEEAIEEIRQGRMLLVTDDEDRENEGDLLMAADKATPEAVNFMAKYGRGLICVPMTAERLQELDLPQMVSRNEARLGTAFTVSVDAREGVTTGISAAGPGGFGSPDRPSARQSGTVVPLTCKPFSSKASRPGMPPGPGWWTNVMVPSASAPFGTTKASPCLMS